MKKITQTAGRDQLGNSANNFAHFNDDVLFGEEWNDPCLSTKTKCIITITSLIASGITDSSLIAHLTNGKNNGITQEEIAAIITHIAFYAGWPKAWAAFRLAKEVYSDAKPLTPKERFQQEILFPIGDENVGFNKYFKGTSYLAPICKEQGLYNVTFEPGCRNNYHSHKATSNGGQILICIGGEGVYREKGKTPIALHPGSIVNIPANTVHFHGARKNSWFAHLALEIKGENTSNEWLDPVEDDEYEEIERYLEEHE